MVPRRVRQHRTVRRLRVEAPAALIGALAGGIAVGACGLVAACSDTSTGSREGPVAPADDRCSPFVAAKVVGAVASAELSEASGLVVSRTNEGVLWTHNDSGDGPRLFAVRTDGTPVATVAIGGGARAIDWEDLAVAPGVNGDDLYIGDIGDNDRKRASVSVYRLHEPILSPTPPAVVDDVVAIELAYGDARSHDAEALLVDPARGDIVLVTKDASGASEIFAAAGPFPSAGRATLQKVGDLAFGVGALAGGKRVTGASISRDGSRVVLRTYESAFLWRRATGDTVAAALGGPPCAIPLADEPQGEAIALLPDGSGYYTTTEGKKPPLVFVGPR